MNKEQVTDLLNRLIYRLKQKEELQASAKKENEENAGENHVTTGGRPRDQASEAQVHVIESAAGDSKDSAFSGDNGDSGERGLDLEGFLHVWESRHITAFLCKQLILSRSRSTGISELHTPTTTADHKHHQKQHISKTSRISKRDDLKYSNEIKHLAKHQLKAFQQLMSLDPKTFPLASKILTAGRNGSL